MNESVAIIGAGLAGSEAALVLARSGIPVELFEARPLRMTPAHTTDKPAELVCSNSLKSKELPSAHGLLKKELELLDSPLIKAAYATAVPAGSALAVDREAFSSYIENLFKNEPLITFTRQEVTEPPSNHKYCIIAAGPLASEGLTDWLAKEFSLSSLHFYDAIAPIIAADSIDMKTAFFAARHDELSTDYINCPFTEEEYKSFFDGLIEADKTTPRAFEQQKFFEACLPVEVLASRGYQSLAFGPLKPIGLIDPRSGRRPYAVCQLRREKATGESYNMVGFQTRLTVGEQKRVFKLIPGLENAEILRYGSIHRNTYLDSPQLLNLDFSFKKHQQLFLAGQLSGNEGYTESIATGHLVARALSNRIQGKEYLSPPVETALGALSNHVTGSTDQPFTPSNVHFGLIPALSAIDQPRKRIGKNEKKELLCKRALEALSVWQNR